MTIDELEATEKQAAANAEKELKIDQELVESITAARDGNLDKVASAGQMMIKRRLRENGFTRKTIPPRVVSDNELLRLPDQEDPATLEDMEGDQTGAKSCNFNDGPDSAPYFGDKFWVYYKKISSPSFVKNVEHLRTYRMPLRKVVTDNLLKDIETREDIGFITDCMSVVGANNGTGASGVQQNFAVSGGITYTSYPPILSNIENQMLNNGLFLMNRATSPFGNGGDICADF